MNDPEQQADKEEYSWLEIIKEEYGEDEMLITEEYEYPVEMKQ